jgi:hypothetical protein
MINRQKLLSDLQSVLRKLEADLLERTESAEVPEVGEWLRAEYQTAKDAGRTAQTFKQWLDDFITQVAAAWVLSCVFARFLEDNQLVDPPRVAGPLSLVTGHSQSRLQQARDEYELYFREHPSHTDREYLLDIFAGLAKLLAGKDVFGPHNPMNALPNWLGPDAAGELLRFFQKIDSDSGELVHDFTDPDWDTRFLGDLYQDLSEAARKKYALLQTPEFVEEFILDRTLEPALEEFGLVISDQSSVVSKETENRKLKTENYFKMIDPACGSGHFLLGAFPRILDRWQRKEPGTNIRELVQRTLNSIHGVDINPFAIAIARFRLLLSALKACGIKRLKDAPAFELNLACGDSLYHGRQRQQMLGDWTDESHYFRTEDAEQLRRILREGTFHAVVANPPYITPKDRAANQVYRELYPKTCHMKYSLAVPFMERILRLAKKSLVNGHSSLVIENENTNDQGQMTNDSGAAGFTGQITANSFMKREFGKKLIESWFPSINLTHVIDTSGAYIPGHGTPTVILLARNQSPVSDTLRTVMGIQGEPSTPDDPSRGLVWSAIVDQIDQSGSQSEFVSVGDSSRELFHKHPWSIGGGGAAELKEQLEDGTTETLSAWSESIGFASFPGTDEVFLLEPMMLERARVPKALIRPAILGDNVRDWTVDSQLLGLVPYDSASNAVSLEPSKGWARYLWHYRTTIGNVISFGGKTRLECGDEWWTWYRWVKEKYKYPFSITFGEVATHNHFVLDRGGKVFKQTAPVIKLVAEVEMPDGGVRAVTEDDHLALLGLLNSSTAGFWMKQVCHNKGSTVDQHGARQRTSPFEDFYAFNGTKLKQFPLPEGRPLSVTKQLDQLATDLQATAPNAILTQRRKDAKGNGGPELCAFAPLRETLTAAQARYEQLRGQMIFLQEELDWECYRLYGLIEERFQVSGSRFQEETKSETCNLKPETSLALGQRAFEIVLARKMARGEVATTWFERHGSTPITELPDHWPDDYKRLVEQRIEVIESNPNIALIEQPEYKRRWNTESWDSQVERALRSWLLDRLESYFDFDGRMVIGHSSLVIGEEPTNDQGRMTNDKGPMTNNPPPLADISLVSVARLADFAAKDDQFMEVASVYRDDPAFDVQRLVDELVQSEHVPLLPILRYKPSGLRNRAEWEKTWELQRLEDGLSDQLSVVSCQLEEATEEGERERLKAEYEKLNTEYCQLKTSIPVPPKYKSSDFISSGGARYWSLRGKLDVPKERWVSFPHCEGPDGTLMIAWAGYNHLQLARAISAYYVDVQERLGGRDDPRLIPLLASIIELLPWLKQWHHDIDPEYNQRMDEVYEGFVVEEAKGLNLTIEEIKAWEPPKKAGRKKKK